MKRPGHRLLHALVTETVKQRLRKPVKRAGPDLHRAFKERLAELERRRTGRPLPQQPKPPTPSSHSESAPPLSNQPKTAAETDQMDCKQQSENDATSGLMQTDSPQPLHPTAASTSASAPQQQSSIQQSAQTASASTPSSTHTQNADSDLSSAKHDSHTGAEHRAQPAQSSQPPSAGRPQQTADDSPSNPHSCSAGLRFRAPSPVEDDEESASYSDLPWQEADRLTTEQQLKERDSVRKSLANEMHAKFAANRDQDLKRQQQQLHRDHHETQRQRQHEPATAADVSSNSAPTARAHDSPSPVSRAPPDAATITALEAQLLAGSFGKSLMASSVWSLLEQYCDVTRENATLVKDARKRIVKTGYVAFHPDKAPLDASPLDFAKRQLTFKALQQADTILCALPQDLPFGRFGTFLWSISAFDTERWGGAH